MRFRFLGGGDVPDWLLSQIFVVSRISAVKIKLLAKLVLARARADAAADAADAHARLHKLLLADGKLEPHEAKGVVAALHLILTSGARFDVADDALTLELQQLGLPNEHTEALVLALRDGRAAVQQHLAEASLALPRLESLRWRVAEDPGPTRAHAVELQLALREQAGGGGGGGGASTTARALHLRLTPDAICLLEAELQAARDCLPSESDSQQPSGATPSDEP